MSTEPKKTPRLLSFKSYVRQRPSAKDAEGEIATEIGDDKDFPAVRSWSALESYLHSQGSYYEPAHRAARALWDEYVRWRKGQREQ